MTKARFTPEQRASHPVYCASMDAFDRWFDHVRHQHADCDSECGEAEQLWQDHVSLQGQLGQGAR
jgi:hypothetical protein